MTGAGFSWDFPEQVVGLDSISSRMARLKTDASTPERVTQVEIDCQQTDRNDRRILGQLQSIAVAGFPECGVFFSGQTRSREGPRIGQAEQV
jgi:hypothetical protein